MFSLKYISLIVARQRPLPLRLRPPGALAPRRPLPLPPRLRLLRNLVLGRKLPPRPPARSVSPAVGLFSPSIYSFYPQVASVTKGVTARGVAAAAGAGLGIGFSGDITSAAKRAELITKREHYASQLENFASMHGRAKASVRCNPRCSLNLLRHLAVFDPERLVVLQP